MSMLQGHYTMLVLATVARQPAHGYAIVKRLNDLTGDAFDLPEGTVYPILHKLEREQLISAKWQRTTTDREIKVYTATARGRRTLRQQVDRWDAITSAIMAILGDRCEAVRAAV